MTRQSYATEIRIIRLMCTGRADLAFVFRAYRKGADGVIIGGCWPGECHYVTEGNYDALGNMLIGRKLMRHVGLLPDRLRLEWVSAAEGARFAEVMSDFAGRLREIGPIGRGEGIAAADLDRKLDALAGLVPFIKLVEREKLRVPTRTEEAIREFYDRDETDRLVQELLGDRLALSEALLLLRDGPLSTREIAERLGLSASDVARHMGDSSRQGLVRFDLEQGRYALAGAGRRAS